jgi:hypothetical protein
MGEVVNLNRARKAKQREGDQAQAAANRVAHGRTRVEKMADRAEAYRTVSLLDGAKLEE